MAESLIPSSPTETPEGPTILINGKAKSPLQVVREAWDEGLRGRRRFEQMWIDAHLAYISKSSRPLAGFSNFFLSLVFSQVRSLAPALWLNHIGDKPYTYFYPTDQSDIHRYKISEAVVNNLQDEGDMPIELLHVLYMMSIYGDAWMKHPWHIEKQLFKLPVPLYDGLGNVIGIDYDDNQEVELTSFDGIKFEARSPWRIVVDPQSHTPRVNRMRWLIDTEPRMPLETLYQMQNEGIIENVDNIKEDGWTDMFKSTLGIGDDKRRTLSENMKGLVFIREYWDNQNNRIIIANDDVILSYGKSPLLGGPPFTHFGFNNLPLEMYSFGLAKQLEYTNKVLNAYAQLAIDEQSLNVYTPVVMGPSITFRSGFNQLTPGIVIHGPIDQIKYLDRPNHQADLFGGMSIFDSWGQRTTGVNLASEGLQASPETSATSSNLAAQANNRFVQFLTRLVGISMGKMAMHNNLTAVQLMGPRNMRMLSDDLTPVFEFVMRGDMAVNLGVNVKDKSQTTTKQEQLTLLISLMDRMMPFMGGQVDMKSGRVIPNLFNAKEVWLEILKTAGIQGYPRFFNDNLQRGQIPPNIQQMIAQMRGQGGMGMPPGQSPGGMFGNRMGQMASAFAPAGNSIPGQMETDNLNGVF